MDQSVLVTVRPLRNYKQTVRICFYLARRYADDLAPYPLANFFAAYNYVRLLPYHPDPKRQEVTSRPRHTLRAEWTGPRDCDDKTVILLAAAMRFGLPARAAVVGQVSRPHHIYPEVQIGGQWMPADATYADPEHDCRFGKKLYNENFRKVFYE